MFILKNKILIFAEHVFSRLIDQRDKNVFIKILRPFLRLHPYSNFLYHYRVGNIRKSLSIAEKLRPKNGLQQKLLDRAAEIAMINDKGWRILKPEIVRNWLFNGKVLFALHNSLPWDLAGYAVRSHQIIKHLQNNGIRVTSVTRPGYPWDLLQHKSKPVRMADNIEKVRYERLPHDGIELGTLDTFYIRNYADKLTSISITRQIPIVHAHSNYLNGLAGTIAAKQIKGLSIYEMRGLWHKSRAILEPGFEKTDLYQYFELMELAAAQQAHVVVAISSALKNYLKDQGIDGKKIKVIPNSVDTEIFEPARSDLEFKKSLGLQDRIVLGFIGSLTGYEGVDLIIRALSVLIDEGLPLSLIIVGDGYFEKELRKEASSSFASRYVHFMGRVPFDEVKRYYSIVDIFPFPRKNFPVCRLVPPLKILEAMAMEKAVIVSNLPPLLEIVKNNDTGLVCHAGDLASLVEAIRILANSKDCMQNLARAAGKWVRSERSWNRIVEEYLSVYAMPF